MRVRFHNLFLRLAVWLLSFQDKPKFRKWITLEEQKNKIIEAVAEGSDFPQKVLDFLSTALGLSTKYFQYASWEILVKSFYEVLSLTRCQISLSILQPTDEKAPDEPWDYDHRVWHQYSHTLAKTYGWSLEYIGNLQVMEALPKIQEISLDEQFQKEFLWMTSRNSVSYDKEGKGKFNPLDRPSWMRKRVVERKLPKDTTPIPAHMIPAGVITYEQIKTQATLLQ